MNAPIKLKIVGAALACALLATAVTFLAPGIFIDYFSSYFETWFNGLSPHQQETVKIIGRTAFPTFGGVIGAIGAIIQVRRKKKAEKENEI